MTGSQNCGPVSFYTSIRIGMSLSLYIIRLKDSARSLKASSRESATPTTSAYISSSGYTTYTGESSRMNSSTNTLISMLVDTKDSWSLAFLYHERPLHLILESFLVDGVLVIDEEVGWQFVIPVIYSIRNGESCSHRHFYPCDL